MEFVYSFPEVAPRFTAKLVQACNIAPYKLDKFGHVQLDLLSNRINSPSIHVIAYSFIIKCNPFKHFKEATPATS
jgi:hypothetical protein